MGNEPFFVIERAKAVWSKAQVVYDSPTRQGFPDALQRSLEIAKNHPECQDALVDLLLSKNQLVAAYALLTLETMASDMVEDLPVELLDSRKKITLHTGSFRTSTDFGGFARQVQKRARQRRSTGDDGKPE